jgi:asparagine synthase (glutamine-hydrolysing)
MVAMLRHRGPDGYGLFRDEGIGLGHARLSIIDLAGGAQPIHNEDQSIWVVYNGEVFNYVELREALERRGHRFYTRSDTEVVVHAYEEYGHGAWAQFNGQFALALWDGRRRKLWLARDRVGILPLFYARVGRRLLFASEAKALFATNFLEPRFNPTGLTQVFTRWSTSDQATVFDGVKSVPLGTAIRFDEQLGVQVQRFWEPDLSEKPGLADLTPEAAAEGLADRLSRAVRLRLRADVPVGAYLSGGLDSSVIGRFIRHADSSPLQTFAVRFVDPTFDETRPQRRMADLLGTDHHEILCGDEEIRETLPDVIWHAESPLLRTAPAPLFLLSRLVRESGMKVVLTGEGADELLAGYHVFKEDKVRRFWARQPESQARPALLSRLYPYVGDGQPRSRLWQQFFRAGLTELDHPFYSHRVRWNNTGWTLRFLSRDIRAVVDTARLEADLEGTLPAGWRQWGALARAQAIEVVTFLSSYLLCSQGDRVAMGHSVEVRYPFLDPDVIDYCSGLPDRLKLRGLRDKVTLRNLARHHVPRDIWDRPKQPYRAPMTTALFGSQTSAYIEDLLSPEYLERFGLVEPQAAGRLVEAARRRGGRMAGEREEMAVIGVLTLQILAYLYQERFAERVTERRAALAEREPEILEDRLCGVVP